jgi:hypothetical protein
VLSGTSSLFGRERAGFGPFTLGFCLFRPFSSGLEDVMNSKSKVRKCVLCGHEVVEEGQDACIGCRQAAGENVETPDEPITKDVCPNCGKEADRFVMGLCNKCVGTTVKEAPKPEGKTRPMEALARTLEQIAEALRTERKATKAKVADLLQIQAEEVRKIQANTMAWVKEQIKKAKATAKPKAQQPKAQPQVKKPGPKNPEEIVVDPCPKCGGTGLYAENGGPCWRCKGKGHMTAQDAWDWNGHPRNPERKPLQKQKAEAPTTNPNQLDMLGRALIKRLLGKN